MFCYTLVLAQCGFLVHFCCWSIWTSLILSSTSLNPFSIRIFTGMWTLPLRWSPLLTSFQSWTQVTDSPIPGLQVRASIWRLRFGKILCKLGQASVPSSPAPENTNTLSYANTQHYRALPVCSDTYPWFFLLLLCSTNSICGLLYLVCAAKPLLPLLTHRHTYTQSQKCSWECFHMSCQCPLFRRVSRTQFISG